jgi:hypothetical protein
MAMGALRPGHTVKVYPDMSWNIIKCPRCKGTGKITLLPYAPPEMAKIESVDVITLGS